ncbi:hypothetical protein [Kitasatospora cineracea]|uniref:hypothetical protein n=1 Tax=Kitasatospora cineracea TaxID=88074 RepID=UPI0033C0D36A
MDPNHARTNAARRYRAKMGGSHRAAIAAVREDRRAHQGKNNAAQRAAADAPVCPELVHAVAHHIEVVCRQFHEMLLHQYAAHNYTDYARMVLYRATDAIEQLHLLVGILVADLRDNGVPNRQIRRFVQAGDNDEIDQFITKSARRQLDGLRGRPAPDNDRPALDFAYPIGKNIRERTGFAQPRIEAAIEAFLTALYGPVGDDAIDEQPEGIRSLALTSSRLVYTDDEEPI